ncbi:MAG: ATP-binding protein [Thermoplasmata archaeon]|nr:ATP-binding protein [Thermoplasmata archaeon]
MTQSLTVAERILYHLYQYIKLEDKYEAPFDVTQDGIAQSCGISRAHAAIELKKLKDGGQILEKLSHVRKAKSRRKVYFLTQEGKAKANKIVEYVRIEKISTDVDSSRISQGSGPARKLRRHISAIPQLKQFFGREDELSMLRACSDDDSIDLISVVGLGGIGKTTLLAKYAKESKSSIFWFTLNEWETEISLLKALSTFLDETGDSRLSNYLKSDRVDLGEVGYLLAESLSENRRILMIDDFDKAPRLEHIVKMIILNAGPNKTAISSESKPELLDEMLRAGKNVKEITLGGIDENAALEILKSRGITGEIAETIAKMTDYHPLLLNFITPNDEIAAKQEMTNFVKKTLLKEISDNDISVIEKCSVLRRPFLAEYLLKDERHVLRLPIFYHISGNHVMHEIVRRIVYDQISTEDRRENHSRAADFYLEERNLAERLFHLILSGRYIESEMLIHSHSDELLVAESPKNLLDEIGLIPPRISKYAASVRILAARASALSGDEKGAVESLKALAKSETGDQKSEVLLELANRPIDRRYRKRLFNDLNDIMVTDGISPRQKSKIALSLANMKFADGDIGACDQYISSGLTNAANSFSLDTVSSLNRLRANVLIFKEKYPEAIDFLSQTAPSFNGQFRPVYHRLLARALAEMGKIDEALANLQSGIEVAEGNGLFKDLADLLLEFGAIKLASKELDGAAESCYRCIEVASSLEDKSILGLAYLNLAQIEAERGNQKEADENREMSRKLAIDDGMPESITHHR